MLVSSTHDLMARAAKVVAHPERIGRDLPVRVGVDLGTAFTVVFVTDEHGTPLAGISRFADVVRDGVVWDFAGAQQLLREMVADLESRTGRRLERAAVTVPPAVALSNHKTHRYVLEGAGLECDAVVDETTAANTLLRIENGAVVDVGGGTTGVAIIRDGEIVANHDEPSGGTHLSLVIAGARRIPFEEAELIKRDPARHRELLPLVAPVLEKISTIVAHTVREHPVERIHLVGGTSAFTGIVDIMTRVTGVPAAVAPHPLLVTPLGVASHAKPHT